MNLIAKTASYLQKNGLKATVSKVSRRLSQSNWLPPEEDSLFEIRSYGQGCTTSCPFEMPEKCPDCTESVTVIIPVFNGEEELKKLLPMLKVQKGIASLQVVVIDSGSTDGSVRLAESFGCDVVSIRHEDFSHSLSRRMGAEKAKGEILVFMTQDALPENSVWLSKLVYPVVSLDCAAATCWEKPRSDAEFFARVSAFNWEKAMESRNRISVLPEDESYESLRYCAQLSDNACAVRRAYYFNVGCHEGKYAEDLGLGLKLLRDGKCIAQLCNPHVIHSHNRDAEYYFSRAITDAVSMKKLFPSFVLDNLSAEESANRILTAYLSNCLFACVLNTWNRECNLREFVREEYNKCIINARKMKKEEALRLLRGSDISFVKNALSVAKGFRFDAGLAVSQARYLMHSVQPYLDAVGTASAQEIAQALEKYYGQSSGYTLAASSMGRGGGRISELEKYSKGV